MIVRGTVRSFLEPTQKERELAVVDKMIWIKSQVQEKRIALVEDSTVRGTTLAAIIKKLRELGALEVHVFSTYDMIGWSCVYGIDTPEREELIAARLEQNLEAITYELGANSVNYLPHTEFGRAIGVPQNELCFSCVTGGDPTYVSKEQRRLEKKKKRRGREGAK